MFFKYVLETFLEQFVDFCIIHGKVVSCNYRGILIYIHQTFHQNMDSRMNSEFENIAQKVSRNMKQKTYASSSVFAEKADDPHLEQKLNSYDFGCCGLISGAQVGSPGLLKISFRLDSCGP